METFKIILLVLYVVNFVSQLALLIGKAEKASPSAVFGWACAISCQLQLM